MEGHLKSDDFFEVAAYPTALVFNKVKAASKNTYSIKGKTNPVEFNISIYSNIATASLKVDRAKYNVKYGPTSFIDNLKDKAIYDEFDQLLI